MSLDKLLSINKVKMAINIFNVYTIGRFFYKSNNTSEDNSFSYQSTDIDRCKKKYFDQNAGQQVHRRRR